MDPKLTFKKWFYIYFLKMGNIDIVEFCRICRTGAYWTVMNWVYYIREAPAGRHTVTVYGHIYCTPTGYRVTMNRDGSCWYSGGGYEPRIAVNTWEKWQEDQNSVWWDVQVINNSDMFPKHAFASSWYARLARALHGERFRWSLRGSAVLL